MIEFTDTLLPNLPESLDWVKGIFYIIEGIFFFGLLLSPLYMIFGSLKKRKKY